MNEFLLGFEPTLTIGKYFKATQSLIVGILGFEPALTGANCSISSYLNKSVTYRTLIDNFNIECFALFQGISMVLSSELTKDVLTIVEDKDEISTIYVDCFSDSQVCRDIISVCYS
jgi:hypothetical protein